MLIRRATASLLVVALLPALAAVSPAEAAQDRRAPTTVTFTTKGWGHGKGLSQYGARNRAKAGQSWQKILRAYYPHTTLGSAHGTIRVLITADTSKDVRVLPTSGLTVRSLGADKSWRLPAKVRGKKVVSWRIQPTGKRSAISFKAGSWHAWRSAKGDAEFSAGGHPIVLVTPAGRASYRGILRSTLGNTVNLVSLDSYVRGVVPQEVPASWPAAAVRAQAVAARTYAAFERRVHRHTASYDLCDTSACQVYGGYGEEHPLADAAVRATAGRIVTYDKQPAFAQFTSSNGGWSVDGGYPYLLAREDRFDKGSAGDPTSTKFTAAAITRNWPGIGDLVSIKVTERDGHGPYGGRATEVTVVGTNSTEKVSGANLKRWLDLRETLFKITTK
ncbi:SpoIID/LytB domain-containing protein [Nocardioides conyzicola]|uniref:SpoIID/LytB domain-containing protein n=1 Tax=Nocardioides conyzicola TaxID=1651781 RepID=A0ABP8WRP5_9ACTN